MDYLESITNICRFFRDGAMCIIGLPQSIKMAQQASYFPEKKRKSTLRRIWDNVCWLWKYKEVNGYYNLYGFDLVECPTFNEYQDYYHFAVSRDKGNLVKKPDSQIVLLRDKYLFYVFMKANKLPVPEVFAYIKDGDLYDNEMNSISWDFLKNEKDFFIKDYTGECASFVKRINDYSELQNERQNIEKGSYILQRTVKQSEEMNCLNPFAVNTLRIVTAKGKDGIPCVLSALLRVGTSETAPVDNWAKGGIAVGINENGFLRDYGYKKPHYAEMGGGRVSVHPDSKIVFSEFQIPMYQQAKEMAIEAHKAFYNIQTIGWDIAITEAGPVFVEGNDNWEISLMQACNKALRKEWREIQ